MEYKLAFKIENHTTYQLACAAWPHIAELPFETVKNDMLIFNEDEGVFALYSPGAVVDYVDHVEDGPVITIKKLYLKK